MAETNEEGTNENRKQHDAFIVEQRQQEIDAEKSFLVKKTIGEYIRNKKQLKVSADLQEPLEEAIKKILDDACARCVANGRKTVMRQDI